MASSFKFGVFVDAENIRLNGGFQMRYDVLRRFAERDGGKLLRLNTYVTYDHDRAHADSEYEQKAQGYQQILRQMGWRVTVKNVMRYTNYDGTVTTKANADLDLAVDAMLQAEKLDQILLLTGDGDFLQVVEALQNKGCRVELLAFRNISQKLRRRVDAFYSGYLIPNLLPIAGETSESPVWGEPDSWVRGTCAHWNSEREFGFFRFVRKIDPNLWVSDPRDLDSPYESVFCHGSKLAGAIKIDDLVNRDTIFEIFIKARKSAGENMTAEEVRLIRS